MPSPFPGHLDYLTLLASDVLRAATATLDPNMTGVPAPNRIFASHGAPAVPTFGPTDTGQLTCHLDHIDWRGLLPFTQAPRGRPSVPVADVRVQLWRPVIVFDNSVVAPVRQSADVGDETAMLMAQAWALFSGVGRAVASATLVTTVSVTDVQTVRGAPLLRQGKTAGFELAVLVGCNDAGSS